MRVLVTGGAGKLGTNVSELLVKTGHQVRVTTHRRINRVRNLDHNVEVCWSDITQPESIKKALDDVDIVVHMAAILPPTASRTPELAGQVNINGTGNLVEIIKKKPKKIPLIYTSSVAVFGPTPDATEPLSPDNNQPHPADVYAETKLQAENIIKQSGLDYVILRLTSVPYLIITLRDLKQMFDIPLNNRVEFCHPESAALAIENAITDFSSVNGKTLIISGGSSQRMLYKDMIGGILGVIGLPLPPERKFTRESYCLDWYDTAESESLLRYQGRTFNDYLNDFTAQLSRQYSKLLVPVMRRFVAPVFGRAISQWL